MANSFRAHSSGAHSADWIAQAGRAARSDGQTYCETRHEETSARGFNAAGSSWIDALQNKGAAPSSGFQDASPFAAPADPPRPVPPEPGPPDPPEASLAASLEEDAYMRGFADGHAQAKSRGDEALANERARYSELRLAMRTLDAAALGALNEDLTATVLALCSGVLGDYAADQNALRARCCAAAKRLGAGPRDLTLHLRPGTLERFDQAEFPGWTFAEDETLTPGALRLTSADGCVRDGPEDWMRAFAEALRG